LSTELSVTPTRKANLLPSSIESLPSGLISNSGSGEEPTEFSVGVADAAFDLGVFPTANSAVMT